MWNHAQEWAVIYKMAAIFHKENRQYNTFFIKHLWNLKCFVMFFSVFVNSILGFYRFTGWHLGCCLGLQCTYGPIQDPVPDSGLFSLLDHCSWYVQFNTWVKNCEERKPLTSSLLWEFSWFAPLLVLLSAHFSLNRYGLFQNRLVSPCTSLSQPPHNTWCLLAAECQALHHAPVVLKGRITERVQEPILKYEWMLDFSANYLMAGDHSNVICIFYVCKVLHRRSVALNHAHYPPRSRLIRSGTLSFSLSMKLSPLYVSSFDTSNTKPGLHGLF